MTPEHVSGLFRAAMWAGLIACDMTGCGPFLASQPMICGPLFGWIMGQVSAGIVIGGLAQLIWMDVTPVGVGIPYDAASVTILAVYWTTVNSPGPISQMMAALVLAAPFGFLFRRMDSLARRLNVVAARKLEAVPDRHLAAALSLGIWGGLAWTWLRYTLLYATVMAVGDKFGSWPAWSPVVDWLRSGLGLAILLLPMAGLGVVLELFLSEEPERRLPGFRSLKGKRS